MQRLLTLKHWQLFSLLVGLWVLVAITGFGSARYASNRLLFASFTALLIGLALLFAAVIYSWFYIVTKRLHERLPASASMSFWKFKVSLIVPPLYLMFNVIGEPTFIPLVFGPLLLLFHLFVMFCMIYCVYFFAKALVAVEIQRKPAPDDYVGTFMQIYFWPLGIWVLQPRINKIFSES
jgi:hypothetical protein